jgi:peptidoglycan/xylan/chitin deacetylase (PgdA/CDA1 family)
MRSLSARAVLVAALFAVSGGVAAAECDNPNALGVSRTLVVDPVALPLIGTMSYHDTLPLEDHEVVLTFDDGPLPRHTEPVLNILASECVKATYFMIGQMATAYPEWARKVAAAGHTVGTHSQSHPLTFHRMPLDKATQEIDQGFASVQAALGDDYKVAPFFRYPGLLHQANSEAYLAERGIMAWSADVPSDDWKRRVPAKEIVKRSVSRLEAKGRGILLLHDIHKKTVAALPELLAELKARGFKIVHVVPGPQQPKPGPEADDAVASAAAPGEAKSPITDPRYAAPLTPVAPVLGTAKIAPALAPLGAQSTTVPKTIAAAAAPGKAALAPRSTRGKAAHAARRPARHARAAVAPGRHAANGVHRPATSAARSGQAVQGQPSVFQQRTGAAPQNSRACSNCRQPRVKKAHIPVPRSG